MHKFESCFVSVLLASNFLVSFSLGYATGTLSQSLPPPYPTNPFFINSFGFTTMREYVTNRNSYASKVPINGCMDMIATVYCPSGQALYTANGGTLYVPMGAVADSSSTGNCDIFSCSWYTVTIRNPSLNDQCIPKTDGFTPPSGPCQDSRGFDLSGVVTGSNNGYLLTSSTPAGDPTCTNYNGGSADKSNVAQSSCWAADYALVESLAAPCQRGVTACIASQMTSPVKTTQVRNPILGYDTTVNGIFYPAGTIIPGNFTQSTVQTVTTTWYVYRLITSLQLQIIPPQPKITVASTFDWASWNCAFICPDPNVNTRNSMKTWVSNMNSADLLTGTRIAFGLYVPAVAGFPCSAADISNGQCWYGIVGMWLGGQGVQTSGCTGVNACAFVQGPHTQLALFKDPTETQPGTIPAFYTWSSLSTMTNQSIAEITQDNVYSQIYSYIDTQSLGPQYTYAGDSLCDKALPTFNTCIITPTPVVVNIPIIYDVLGSKQYSTWLTQYPSLPPNGGTTSGAFNGHVYDSTNGRPIAGACIGLNGPCTGASAQQQTQTDSKGFWQLRNMPIGTYAVYANVPGYNSGLQTNQQVVVGGTTAVDFQLSPLPTCEGAGVAAVANPIPYQPPVFSGFCIPSWAIITTAAVIVSTVLAIYGGPVLSQRMKSGQRKRNAAVRRYHATKRLSSRTRSVALMSNERAPAAIRAPA